MCLFGNPCLPALPPSCLPSLPFARSDARPRAAAPLRPADTVWLRDPTPYLDQHPSADWFVSTDCLSHAIEAAWQPAHNQPRCGHIAGNVWGRAWNTGVFAVRNRPSTLATLAKWRDLLLDPARSSVTVRLLLLLQQLLLLFESACVCT